MIVNRMERILPTKRLLILGLAFLLSGCSAVILAQDCGFEEVTISWDFEGATTAGESTDADFDVQDANWGAGVNFQTGTVDDGFVSGNGGGDAMWANNWGATNNPTSAPLALAFQKYFEFCFDVPADVNFDLNSFNFDHQGSPTDFPPNYTVQIFNQGTSGNTMLTGVNLVGSGMVAGGSWLSFPSPAIPTGFVPQAGGTVCIRIYGWGTTLAEMNGAWRIDNVVINGQIEIEGPDVEILNVNCPIAGFYQVDIMSSNSVGTVFDLSGEAIDASAANPSSINGGATISLFIPTSADNSLLLDVALPGDPTCAQELIIVSPPIPQPNFMNYTCGDAPGTFSVDVQVLGFGQFGFPFDASGTAVSQGNPTEISANALDQFIETYSYTVAPGLTSWDLTVVSQDPAAPCPSELATIDFPTMCCPESQPFGVNSCNDPAEGSAIVNLDDVVGSDLGGSWTPIAAAPALIGGNMASTDGLADGSTISYSQEITGIDVCAPATITVTITVIDCQFCTDLDAAWTIPGPYCQGDALVDLDDFVTGDPGGTWSLGAAPLPGGLFDPQTAGNNAVTYTVNPPAGDPANCLPDPLTQDINVIAAPSPPIVVGNPCVEGLTFNLAAIPGVDEWYSDESLSLAFLLQGANLNQPAGTYYAVAVQGTCKSAATPVTLVAGPDAGDDVGGGPADLIEICNDPAEGTISINLDNFLSVNAGTGSWGPAPAGGPPFTVGGNINANGVTEGTYDYVFTVPGVGDCPPDEAVITVTVRDCEDCTDISAAWTLPTFPCEAPFGQLDLDVLVTGNTGGTWTVNAVNNVGVLDISTAGNYTVIYTVDPPIGDSPDCDPAMLSQVIEVFPVPAAPGVASPVCLTIGNPTSDLGLIPGIDEWYFDASLNNTTLLADLNVGVGTYYGITINAQGCASEAAILEVVAAANAGADMPGIELCNDATEASGTQSATQNMDALLSVPAASGSWDLSPIVGGPQWEAGNILNADGATLGEYDFTFTVAGTATCPADEATITVTVIDCLIPCTDLDAAWTAPAPQCVVPGGDIDLDALVTGDAGGSWTVNNVASTNLFSISTAGVFNVVYTLDPPAGDPADCPSEVSLPQEIEIVAADATPLIAPVCLDGNATINLGAVNTEIDAWYSAIPLEPASELFDLNQPAGTYYGVVINSTGCVSAAAIVEVFTAPDAGPDLPATLCDDSADGNTVINPNDLLAPIDPTTGAWDFTPLVNAPMWINGNTQIDAHLSDLGPHEFFFSVNEELGSPCSADEAVLTINVIDCECTFLDANWDVPANLCVEAGATLNLNDLITGDTGGEWFLDNTPISNEFSLDDFGVFSISYSLDPPAGDLPTCEPVAIPHDIEIIETPAAPSLTPSCLNPFNLGSVSSVNEWYSQSDLDPTSQLIGADLVVGAGVYYGVAIDGTCVSSAGSIEILAAANAGADNTATVCNDNTAPDGATLDMNSLLIGIPAFSGDWVFPSPVGGPIWILDDNISADGVEPGNYIFEYEVQGLNGCLNDISEFEITVESCDPDCLAAAGTVTPGEYDLCEGESMGFPGGVFDANQGADYDYLFVITPDDSDHILATSPDGQFSMMDDTGSFLSGGDYCIRGINWLAAEGLDLSAGTIPGLVNDAGLGEVGGACIDVTDCVPYRYYALPELTLISTECGAAGFYVATYEVASETPWPMYDISGTAADFLEDVFPLDGVPFSITLPIDANSYELVANDLSDALCASNIVSTIAPNCATCAANAGTVEAGNDIVCFLEELDLATTTSLDDPALYGFTYLITDNIGTVLANSDLGDFNLMDVTGDPYPVGPYCLYGVSYLLTEGVAFDGLLIDQLTNDAGLDVAGGACFDVSDCWPFTIVAKPAIAIMNTCVDQNNYTATITITGPLTQYDVIGTAVDAGNPSIILEGVPTVFNLSTATVSYSIMVPASTAVLCASEEITFNSPDCDCPIDAGFVFPDDDEICFGAGLSGTTSANSVGSGNPADYTYVYLLTDMSSNEIFELSADGAFDFTDSVGDALAPADYCVTGVYYFTADGLNIDAAVVGGITNDAGEGVDSGACIDLSPCEIVTVNPLPPTPDDENLCIDVPMVDLSAEYPLIDNWYANADLTGAFVVDPVVVGVGTYYGTVENATCESEAGVFTITDTPEITFSIDDAPCDGDGNFAFVVSFLSPDAQITLSGSALAAPMTINSGESVTVNLTDEFPMYELIANNIAGTGCPLTINLFTPNCNCAEIEIVPASICLGDTFNLNEMLEEDVPDGLWMIYSVPVGATPAFITDDSLFVTQEGISTNGEYGLSYIAVNAGEGVCADSISVTLELTDVLFAGDPDPGIPQRCNDDTTPIDLFELLIGEDAGGTWSELTVPASTGTAFNALGGEFIPDGQAAGVYTFEYQHAIVEACPLSSAMVQLELFDFPEVMLASPAPICVNMGDGLLNFDDLVLDGSLLGVWTDEDVSLAVPVSIDPTVYNFNDLAEGSYTFSYTVQGPLPSCGEKTNTIEVVLEVCPTCIYPDAPIVLTNPSPICLEDLGNEDFEIDLPPGLEAAWYEAGSTVSIATGAKFAPNSAGVFFVELYYPENDTCRGPQTELLLETIDFEVTAFQDTLVLEGSPVDLYAVSSNPALEITWLWYDQNDNEWYDSAIQVAPTESMLYTVLALTEGEECAAEDFVNVTVFSDPFVEVPNAFAPNGLNSIFRPLLSPGVEVVTFEIYNRWGEPVYVYPGFGEPSWDGIKDGEPQGMGVFVYYLTYREIGSATLEEPMTGNVTLIR
ncbi:gliding motility-associated C-terminal domain-containing protein [Chitinophagales bacterium]|nr:gliding motility-associated C-terminal domain-containing protein [Chitinophagales bacterium]